MSRRSIEVLLWVYLAFAASAWWSAWSMVGRPSPGFFVAPNGMIGVFSPERWPGVRAGLRGWDQIVSVDGEPFRGSDDLRARIDARAAGTVFVYDVVRSDAHVEIPVPSIRFELDDFLIEALPFFLTSLVFALAAVGVYFTRPSDVSAGFAVFGVAAGAAILRADYFLPAAGVLLMQFLIFAVAATIVHLALVFPERPRWFREGGRLLAWPYGIAALLGAARTVSLLAAPELWAWIDKSSLVFITLASLFLLWMLRRGERWGSTPVLRERARVATWGMVPGMIVALVGVTLRWATGATSAASVGALLAAWLGVGFFAFATVKRDIFGFEIFARRSVTFAILWVLTLVAYGVLLVVVRALLGAMDYSPLASLPLLVLFAAILPLPGVVPAIQSRVESLLFPLHVSLLEVVERISTEVSSLMEPSELARRVREALCGKVGLLWVGVYVSTDAGLDPADAPSPPPDESIDALRLRLALGPPLSIFDLRDGPAARWMVQSRFVLLLPLIAQSRLEGVLAIGEAPGGHVFDPEEVDALAALGSRVAIALANARAYDRLQVLEARQREENRALREELEIHPGFAEIVGGSGAAMREVFRAIDQVAATDTTVLLGGETGTGKELVARALHIRSPRRDGPIVKLNCAAIPSGLIESELFGHERGAFTDAATRRRGSFELASGGTILLDEIGELPLAVQAKLLRVLQEREFERIGGYEVLHADVRVIASTNRDLRAEVAARRFREDLFFRLNVFPIVLPPLRERPEDIAPLVRHFLEKFGVKLGKSVRELTPESWIHLERYAWPGNVRELANVIERALVLCQDEVLTVPALEPAESEPIDDADDEAPPSLGAVLEATKVTAIRRALAQGGNQVRAAKLLGLTPPGLSRMMRELGIRT